MRQGDIYWLDDCRPLHGELAKRRPVIVVSPTPDIPTRPDVVVVACTSSSLPSDVTAIELPSTERTPQTKTRLHRRTWAIPEWQVLVERSLLQDYIGHLSGATLRKLMEAVSRIQRSQ